jgi:hypothetical protein
LQAHHHMLRIKASRSETLSDALNKLALDLDASAAAQKYLDQHEVRGSWCRCIREGGIKLEARFIQFDHAKKAISLNGAIVTCIVSLPFVVAASWTDNWFVVENGLSREGADRLVERYATLGQHDSRLNIKP